MSTLVIENVKDEYINAFIELSKALRAKCTIEPSKKAKNAKPHDTKSSSAKSAKVAKLSKFEKAVLKASAEAKQARAKGNCKTFANAREAFADAGLI